MPDGVVIRKCRLDECPAILGLWKASEVLPRATDNLEVLLGILDNPNATLLVAEHRSELAGTVIAAWDGWRGNIYRLAVLPEYRRKGIGAQLVREAEQFLSSVGARRIGGLVTRDTPLALQFWDSTAVSGYKKDDSFVRYTKNL